MTRASIASDATSNFYKLFVDSKTRTLDVGAKSVGNNVSSDLGHPVYVFLTGDGFPTDPHQPEAPELQALQVAHRQRLTSSGRDYNPTASSEHLDQKIRTLQVKVDRLQEELQGKKGDLKVFRVMFNEITKNAIQNAFKKPLQVNVDRSVGS